MQYQESGNKKQELESENFISFSKVVMMKSKRSWNEKLYDAKEPQVKKLDKAFADMPEGCIMLIATPEIVDNYIKQIPKGKNVDINTLRNDLAQEFHAEKTCPLTTGIFLRIVAEAAYEKYLQGTPLNKVTPFWRVIDDKSKLAKKLSFGVEVVHEFRKKEKMGDRSQE